MNKNILLSLAIIGVVAAVVTGATTAYFSDTDVSGPNTFTAGTLEIDVDGTNGVWEDGFILDDMKPCFTDYINFKINNTGNNPVDVIKKLVLDETFDQENGVNEPECEAYGGTWNGTACIGGTPVNDIENIVNYDLSVEVWDDDPCDPKLVWWQTIYVDGDNMTIGAIYGGDGKVYLGMIPVGHYMLVTQSYHMRDTDEPQNEYQSDQMAFDITVEGKQITGTSVLENKTAGPEYKLILNDVYTGTLTYKVKNSTFDFGFTGKVTQPNTAYTLLYAIDPWPQTGSVVLGTTVSDASGNVDFSDNVELNQDIKDAKVWLVLSSDWDGTQMTGWSQADYLLETGLIWYEDTDL